MFLRLPQVLTLNLVSGCFSPWWSELQCSRNVGIKQWIKTRRQPGNLSALLISIIFKNTKNIKEKSYSL